MDVHGLLFGVVGFGCRFCGNNGCPLFYYHVHIVVQMRWKQRNQLSAKSKRLNKGKLNTGRLRETILVAKIRKYSF